VNIFDRIREYLRRRNDLSAGRDPVWDDAPTATMPAPVPAAEPACKACSHLDYGPCGCPRDCGWPSCMGERARAAAAAIVAQAEAEQAQAAAKAWREADPIVSLPAAPPPPMPPSDLSRIMVSQLPSPPPNDRNFAWTHQYADYMRRVGVATGTSTDLEHTMAWGMPALEPGDGTGVRLAGQEHGETGPEVSA
jgi:hypothetical protein